MAKSIPEVKIGNEVYQIKDRTAREHLVEVSTTQPTSEDNKLWIKNQENEYEVPTMDEFNGLKSALIDTLTKTELSLAWEQGTIRSTTGEASGSSSTRIRTDNFINADTLLQIKIPTGYKTRVFWYTSNSEDNFVGVSDWLLTGMREFKGNLYYKMILAYSDDASILPTQGANLVAYNYFATDKTLTLQNKAADSAVTGNEITKNRSAISNVINGLHFPFVIPFFVGRLDSYGKPISDNNQTRAYSFPVIKLEAGWYKIPAIAGVRTIIYYYSTENGNLSTKYPDAFASTNADLCFYVPEETPYIRVYCCNNVDTDEFTTPPVVYIEKLGIPGVVPLEIGGYESDGALKTTNLRFRSSVAFPVVAGNQYKIEYTSGFGINIYFYDGLDATSETYVGKTEGFKYNYNVFTVPDGCTHIRINGKNSAGTEITDLPNMAIKEINYEIDESQNNRNDNTFTAESLGWSENSWNSGMTVVHNLLFWFGVSSDDHSNYVKGYVAYLDNKNKSIKIISEFTHNLGHVNSVDYCEHTDCIIFGNGGNDASLPGKFYVLENFFAKYKENPSRQFSISECIEFDCSSESLGSKMNVIWGDGNRGRYNTAIMVTNNMQTIRKIILGKNTTQLSHGAYVSGDHLYNGTFEILKEYTQTTLSTDVVQDMDYRDHTLYAGVGHGLHTYWKMKLNNDGTISKEVITYDDYNNSGEEQETGIGGLTVEHDYVIAYIGNNIVAMFSR